MISLMHSAYNALQETQHPTQPLSCANKKAVLDLLLTIPVSGGLLSSLHELQTSRLLGMPSCTACLMNNIIVAIKLITIQCSKPTPLIISSI